MGRYLFIIAMWVVAAYVGPAGAGDAPLRDAPVVWYEDDRRDIEKPKERDPSLTWDYFDDSWGWPRERWTNPVRLVRNFGKLFGGDQVKPAANVNSLDEVPNSTWFTNRIGIHPMSPREAARGPGDGKGPDRSDKWTVISAKTEGVTPGFNIRDAKGDVYVIKFDPPGCLNMTTTADVISSLILHAAGYNVPEESGVTFRRRDIVVGETAKIRVAGKKRPMTEEDIDAILNRVDKLNDDEWLAVSSKFISGEPVGPFDYRVKRKDDPNDTVDHWHRRELRGLYVFAAWLNHFDVKQQNTLDMYVEEDGRRYVKHYLIDFASTLGASADVLNPRLGYEFGLDVAAIGRRTFTLGLSEDDWRKRERPDFQEVGYFDSTYFDPGAFAPLQPNSAFANTTKRDAYWAAKIVAAFRDEHIDAIVAEGGYRVPGAADYVAAVLKANRDRIARYYFERVAPLDFFRNNGDRVVFEDLGVKYTVYPGAATRYRVRCATVDKNRSRQKSNRSDWKPLDGTSLALDSGVAAEVLSRADLDHPFLAMEFQLNRGEGWSGSVTAYLAPASGRIIAVSR
jgi:hypothetical protein